MKAVSWRGEDVAILDQRALPHEERFIEATSAEDVAEAIRGLAVRGAPLLGIAAGYGLAVAARRSGATDGAALLAELRAAGATLAASRPTAVNLGWAVERVLGAAEAVRDEGADRIRAAVLEEGLAIEAEDEASCRTIGKLGAELLPEGARVLTHCNAGALATGGWGTALGMIVAAHEAGKGIRVWVGETRPVLQGARLTAWELRRQGIPMTLVADTVPGSLMARGLVDVVVVGADRIAANGDAANKVGTYALAVLARHHGIPFYVAAPVSTFDPATATGEDIAIEERDPLEVAAPLGVPFAPAGTPVANPAFDVTPASLITAIVTDRGVVESPGPASIRRLLGDEGRSGAGVPR